MKAILLALVVASGLFAQPPAHSVTLTWADPNNPATQTTYAVYRAGGICGVAVFSTTPIKTGISGLTFVDTPIAPGVYCYQVTAIVGSAESAPSPQAVASVPPFAPVSLNVVVK